MKTLAFLILFSVAAHGAAITTTNVAGDITTKIYERTGEEGLPLRRSETIYRGKTKILQTIHLRYKKEKRNILCHSYCIGGKLAVAEDYENGAITGLTVCLPGSDDFDTFIFEPDGTVKPASNKAIELIKDQFAVYRETAEKMFQKHPPDEDASKVLYETRSKLGDLEEQELSATNIPGEIKIRIEERKDKDGKPDTRVETSYRGEAKILQVASRRSKEGKMVVWSRTYSVKGKSIAMEFDEDGDGLFETLMLHSQDSNDLEIFERYADGRVIPKSTTEINLVKKTTGLATEPLARGIQKPGLSDEEFGKSLEEARRKIEDLNKTNAIR